MNATVAGRIVTPNELFDGVIRIENGRIEEIVERTDGNADRDPPDDWDFGNALIVPGFIDVHMHGLAHWLALAGDGRCFHCSKNRSNTARPAFCRRLRHCRSRNSARLDAMSTKHKRPPDRDAARVLGAHFEGPFINPQRRGGMDEAFSAADRSG